MEAVLDAATAGRFPAAIKLLTSLLDAEESPAALARLHRARATCYGRMELHKHGLSDALRAIALDASDPRSFLALAEANLALGWAQPAAAAATAGRAAARAAWDVETALQLHALTVGQHALTVGQPAASSCPPTIQPPAAAAEELAATGVRHLAAGRLSDALTSLDAALAVSPLLMPALLARGTARALAAGPIRGTGAAATAAAVGLQSAVDDFTACAADATCAAEATLRRGQARAAMGQETAALADFATAVSLARGAPGRASAHVARASLLLKCRDVDAGALAATAALDEMGQRGEGGDATSESRDNDCDAAEAWHLLGACQAAAGDCAAALDAFGRASALRPQWAAPHLAAAHAHRELAQDDDAERCAAAAAAVTPPGAGAASAAPDFVTAMVRHACGRHCAALASADASLASWPSHLEARFLRACCLHALGAVAPAVDAYDAVIAIADTLAAANTGADPPPGSALLSLLAWYQREVALYAAPRWTVTPVTTVLRVAGCPHLPPSFQEAWAKKMPPAVLMARGDYHPQPPLTSTVAAAVTAPVPRAEAIRTMGGRGGAILESAARIGAYVQYNCPGFHASARQRLAAGLAAIALAQAARVAWCDPTADAGWREWMQRGVDWRVAADPLDCCLWIDGLPPAEYAAGFGSHTAMIAGQAKVVRYYANSPRAVATAKRIAFTTGAVWDASGREVTLSAKARRAVAAAYDPGALWDAIGHDFYVITMANPRRAGEPAAPLEGTRLTVVRPPFPSSSSGRHIPPGVEFSIRTPCTPPRWALYDAELTHAWRDLRARVLSGDGPHAGRAALTLSYLWYSFMPLTRGTAALGYAAILGLFMGAGMPITAAAPPGVQLDWEAILAEGVDEFVARVGGWLLPPAARGESAATLWRPGQTDELDSLPPVEDCFPTWRLMISALNVDVNDAEGLGVAERDRSRSPATPRD